MRRWVVFVFIAMMLPLPSTAQFQPVEAPDWSGFTAREDIAAAGELEGAQRVLRFVQVSDAHILDDDAPEPIRVASGDALFYNSGVSDGAERPQDEYTDEVLNAMIETINAVHAADRLDFVLNTGDNIDNSLENELMRFVDNWEGTLTTTGPVSGFECKPDGQSADVDDDSTDVTDACTHLPEFANTPLASNLPWFSAFGNHDGLIQGNVPIEPSFQEIAAESGRRFLHQDEYVGMHFAAGTQCVSGAPAGQPLDDFGHGYGFAGERLCDEDPDNDGYYTFSAGGLQVIVLDTVNDDFVTGNENLVGSFVPESEIGYDVIGGYAQGGIDPVQYDWMIETIKANPNRLVVLMSHHTVNSMFSSAAEGNCGGPNGECLHDLLTEAGYKTGPEIQAALAEHPNVVAWIGGHTHRHRIEDKTVDGAASPGFWNVETSSLIDLPQESRIVELWVTADGSKGFFALQRIGHDFQMSKDAAAGDEQWDPDAAAGAVEDQDVLLWFDVPPGVTLSPQPSLPRYMIVSHTTAADGNGTHGLVGDNITAVIEVTENLGGLPVTGLDVDFVIDRADDAAAGGLVRVADARMQETAPGRYEHTFRAEAARVHYLDVTVTDPSGTYGDVMQTYSIVVDGVEDDGPSKKKSPGLSPLSVLCILGLAWAMRR